MAPRLSTLPRLAAVLALTGAASTTAAQDATLFRAARVYTGTGEVLENAAVRVDGGKIAAVGTGAGSGGLEVAAITPGLVDLSCDIDTGWAAVEQATETEVQSILDSLDFFNYRWERELRAGVTTVMVSPPDFDVIGGLSAVLKTGGEPTRAARLVKADAMLRASMGSQPSFGNRAPRGSGPRNFYYRRPTTRMGVEWVFRKAFYDAMQQGTEVDDPGLALRNRVLGRVLSGDLTIIVKADALQDVRTALFAKRELRLPNVILERAAEAWREPRLLAESGAAVVLPPFTPSGRLADGYVNDSYFMPLDAAKRLDDLGVTFALSTGDGRDPGTRLGDQAGLAMRGGLSFDAALRAVTLTPARLAGVADRVGSLEVGKDADLVLWSGTPFEPSSRVLGVVLDGRLVLDPRSRD